MQTCGYFLFHTKLQIEGIDGIKKPLFLFQALCCGYSLESSCSDSNEHELYRVRWTVINSFLILQSK